MKNMILLILILSITVCQAQDQESLNSGMNNEIGLDMTGFIKQFINFSSAQNQTVYSPTFIVTYRRKFSSGNIRTAIGGRYNSYNLPAQSTSDENTYQYVNYYAFIRIGWEWKSDIGKRWQVFYGLDLQPFTDYYQNDALSFSGGYAYGRVRKEGGLSAGPVLGFRFKLNDRLSLLTESRLLVSYSEESERQYFTSTSIYLPERAQNVEPTIYSLGMNYFQPLALYVTFDF